MTRHRRRLGRLALGALVLTVVALVPLSSPAAAYAISYSMRNETSVTLTLERARIGIHKQCFVYGTAYTCSDDNNRGRDYTRSVRPLTAAPGDTVVIHSDLDWLEFRQLDTIEVVYDIPGRGKVVLHSKPQTNTCTVVGTKDFTCVNLALRDWALRPAA